MINQDKRDDKGIKIRKHCSCGKVYEKALFMKSLKIQRDYQNNKELGRYLDCNHCKSTMFLKTIVTFLICFMVVSCGTNEQPTSDKVTAEEIKGNNPESPDSSDIVVAIELESLANLPECIESNDSQLAFVVDENAFYTCKLLIWKRIEIKGEAGTKGDKGEKGDSGVNTNIYQNATITNTWVDPITGYEWVLGAAGGTSEISTRCTGNYLPPTRAEAVQAANNGLLVAAGDKGYIKEMWTTDMISGQYVKVKTNADMSISYLASANANLPIHCKKIE